MILELKLGKATFPLETAAISAVRYRARYGHSVVSDLDTAQAEADQTAPLVRMCYEMLPQTGRPSIGDFALACHREPTFLAQAQGARMALLSVDPDTDLPREGDGRTFDEYDVLAGLAMAHMDMGLIYELPVMHLAAVLHRMGELGDPDRKVMRKMTDEEISRFYHLPRRPPDGTKGAS